MEDAKYRDEIVAAINLLKAENKPISVKSVISELTPLIISTYDSVDGFLFKNQWQQRVSRTLKMLKQDFKKDKANWEYIFIQLLNRRENITPEIEEEYRNESDEEFEEVESLHRESSTSSRSSSSTKQTRLKPCDKEKVKEMFASLKEEEMWVLSSGTVVEKVMEKLALECAVEHPSHSLILDANDPCWKRLFSEADLLEIRNYNLNPLPIVPEDLKNELSLFDSATTVQEFYNILKQRPYLDREQKPSLEWINSSIHKTLKLLSRRNFNLNDQSESEILNRIWGFIDECFADCIIDCKSGEKSSLASSNSRNQERGLGTTDKIERKLCGRKMDLIFKWRRFEFGCAECSRENVVNSTKELHDGAFKMPKVMKDMLIDLCVRAPLHVRNFMITGFLMMESKFTLVTLDSPAGYVCRINRTRPLEYPILVEDIAISLFPILEQVYQARMIMENNCLLLRKAPFPIGFDSGISSCPLPSCFQVETVSSQKRKKIM